MAAYGIPPFMDILPSWFPRRTFGFRKVNILPMRRHWKLHGLSGTQMVERMVGCDYEAVQSGIPISK